MATPAKKPPARFGYATAAVVGLGFGVFAAFPYLSTAASRLAQGQAITADAIKRDVRTVEKEMEKKEEKSKPFEPKSILPLADGSAFVGGKQGLMEWRNGVLVPVAGYPGMEVRGMAFGKDEVLWVAAKDGLWMRTGVEWRNVKEGDLSDVTPGPDGSLFISGKSGVFRSEDGSQWDQLKGTGMGGKRAKDGEMERPKSQQED